MQRGKLIMKGGRNPPGPLGILTMNVQPQTAGVVGAAAIPATVVVQNAVNTLTFTVTGLPTGITASPTGPNSIATSTGPYSAAGTFNVQIHVEETGTGRVADFYYTCVVAASAATIIVATGQVLPFGSDTLAGEAGIAAVITGSPLATAVLNTEDGAAATRFQILNAATGVVTRKAGSTVTLGQDYVLSITYTAQDTTSVTRDVIARIEAVAGRSVSILTEFNSAIAALTVAKSGQAIYLRAGPSYGDIPGTSNKLYTVLTFITKHTGQAVLPEIGQWWWSTCNNLQFTWLDFHREYPIPTDKSIPIHHRLSGCNGLYFEDCTFRGRDDFDVLAPKTTSYEWQALGRGLYSIGGSGGNHNLYVRRCTFRNLWTPMYFAGAPIGGVQEYTDNYFSPNAATLLYTGVIQASHVSLKILRNYFGGGCSGLLQGPAYSHFDHVFVAMGALHNPATPAGSLRGIYGWACPNIEISQNIFNRENEPGGGVKPLFFAGFAFQDPYAGNEFTPVTSSYENIKILDNAILTESINGFNLPRMSGENNVIAGNTITNWDPAPGPYTPQQIFNGFDHPPNDPGSVLGRVFVVGNVFALPVPAVLFSGMTVVRGPGATNTNIETGYANAENYGGWANVFEGGATMKPSNRDEVFSKLVLTAARLAEFAKPPGAINNGHHTWPTNLLDPAGASMVDTNGNYWLT